VPEEARGECRWLVLRNGIPLPGDAGGGVALFAEVRLTRPLGRVLRALHASVLIDALDKLVAAIGDVSDASSQTVLLLGGSRER